MKYLKRFSETLNESSSNESHTDIIQNVKDILLPINDMGYDISVTGQQWFHYQQNHIIQLTIRVVSWTDEPLLMTDEVKEEFIRMKDYLQSEGYYSIIAFSYIDNHSRDENDIDDFIHINEPIQNLIFNAKK